MALSHKFRQEIVNFLIELTFFDDANGRKAILLTAGLDTAIPNIDLSGPKAEFVNLLVEHLAQYGDVDGQPALVRLLQSLGEQVGQDRRASLHTYCEQILLQEQMAQKASEIEPYRGLSAFQEEDAQWFFGREIHTQKVLDAVRQFPFVAVLGASGSGKSSLVYAGVLPKLRAEGWAIAAWRPGELPVKALAAALMPIWQPDAQGSKKLTEIKHTHTCLIEKTLAVSDILEAIVLPAGKDHLVLFVDQFEEIYACKQEQERTCFLENLLSIVDLQGRQGIPPTSVIITLRSDFLGQTHSYAPLSQAIAAHGIIVPVMNEAELRDAIAKPAEQAESALDIATVDLLIEQSKGREGALPLLQFALTRIWNGMAQGVEPADTLQQIGGVGGALAGEAQRLYESLPEPDRAIVRRAFLHLVHLGEGTRDTRRRVSIPEIVAHDDNPDHVHEVLRTFSQPGARLITLMSGMDDEERAEVTHEALFEHWEMLKEWLGDNREDLRFQRRLADAANHWEMQKRPKGLLWRSPDLEQLQAYHKRAERDMTPIQIDFFRASTKNKQRAAWLRWGIIITLSVLTCIAGIAAYFAIQARNEATTERDAAREAKEDAKVQAEEAERRKEEAVQQYHIALIRSFVAYAYKEDALNNRERAALLARQAFLLKQRFEANVDNQIIEDALRTIFRTASIIEEPGSSVLVEQVCQKVKSKVALKEEENLFVRIAGSDTRYEPACPELLDLPYIQLRKEKMKTTYDKKALSLNVREVYGLAYPVKYIENDFEPQNGVIVDGATGLMWQQSGSEDSKTYEEAQEYIKQLNHQKFAGHDDWRLPTVEELLSLAEEKKQDGGLFIDSIFDTTQQPVWSADLCLWQLSPKEEPKEMRFCVLFDNGPDGPDGYVRRTYFTPEYKYHVRAVRSLQNDGNSQ